MLLSAFQINDTQKTSNVQLDY